MSKGMEKIFRIQEIKVAEAAIREKNASPDYLEIYYSREKGRGIKTKREFLRGQFILYYHGRITTSKKGSDHYFFQLQDGQTPLFMDASEEDSSFGRLLNDNHLNPNIEVKPVLNDDGIPIPAFFAKCPIAVGDELEYDYGGDSESYWWRTNQKETSLEGSILADKNDNDEEDEKDGSNSEASDKIESEPISDSEILEPSRKRLHSESNDILPISAYDQCSLSDIQSSVNKLLKFQKKLNQRFQNFEAKGSTSDSIILSRLDKMEKNMIANLNRMVRKLNSLEKRASANDEAIIDLTKKFKENSNWSSMYKDDLMHSKDTEERLSSLKVNCSKIEAIGQSILKTNENNAPYAHCSLMMHHNYSKNAISANTGTIAHLTKIENKNSVCEASKTYFGNHVSHCYGLEAKLCEIENSASTNHKNLVLKMNASENRASINFNLLADFANTMKENLHQISFLHKTTQERQKEYEENANRLETKCSTTDAAVLSGLNIIEKYMSVKQCELTSQLKTLENKISICDGTIGKVGKTVKEASEKMDDLRNMSVGLQNSEEIINRMLHTNQEFINKLYQEHQGFLKYIKSLSNKEKEALIGGNAKSSCAFPDESPPLQHKVSGMNVLVPTDELSACDVDMDVHVATFDDESPISHKESLSSNTKAISFKDCLASKSTVENISSNSGVNLKQSECLPREDSNSQSGCLETSSEPGLPVSIEHVSALPSNPVAKAEIIVSDDGGHVFVVQGMACIEEYDNETTHDDVLNPSLELPELQRENMDSSTTTTELKKTLKDLLYNNITLPSFTEEVMPYLVGAKLDEPIRRMLFNNVVSELINHLDKEKLLISSSSNEQAIGYSMLQKKLLQKYPNIIVEPKKAARKHCSKGLLSTLTTSISDRRRKRRERGNRKLDEKVSSKLQYANLQSSPNY